MIAREIVNRYQTIIDRSGLIGLFVKGMNRDRRGRPTNEKTVRLFWLGAFLAVHAKGSLLIRDIHRVLTEDLYFPDQVDLGITGVDDNGDRFVISESALQNVSKLIDRHLEYGENSAPGLTPAERNHRRETIQTIIDAICDVFDMGFASGTYAIDATNVWAWLKSHRRPEEGQEETLKDKRRRTDGKWGVKTAKNGDNEPFFGYHEHTIVQVAQGTSRSEKLPPLVARFWLEPPDGDLAKITIAMIDRMTRPVTDIIADRHYQYKVPEDWRDPLAERGIRQTLDLRKDQQGFTDLDGVRFAAGSPHCPATPDYLGTIERPDSSATDEEKKEFRRLIDARQQYALKLQKVIDPVASKCQWACPAVAGKVACPLVDGSIQAADLYYKQTGRQVLIVQGHPDPNAPALPVICRQPTMVIDPGGLRKLHQDLYWGSEKWEAMYNKRSAVEGSYGNRKNEQTENYRRGQTRATGIGKATLLAAVTVGVYNLRMLRNWHDNTGQGDPDHPLLTPNPPQPLGVIAVTEDQYRDILRQSAA